MYVTKITNCVDASHTKRWFKKIALLLFFLFDLKNKCYEKVMVFSDWVDCSVCNSL